MTATKLRIATRESNLALWQANHVAALLRLAHPGVVVELVPVVTAGDRAASASLAQLGGVGVFTREIQVALLEQRADVAVHSLKDLPTQPVAGICLAAVPERAAPWDALVLPRDSDSIAELGRLRPQACIGTGSLRRRAQLLHRRPDLKFLDVRGNVETRLRKLDEGSYDALILAEAGLVRLGLQQRISARLAPPEMLPAAGQGALGIECRADDAEVRAAVEAIDDPSTRAAVSAERQILFRLRAGCHAPVGVSTTSQDDRLAVECVVLSPDGKRRLRAEANGLSSDAIALGTRVAEDLAGQGRQPLIDAAG